MTSHAHWGYDANIAPDRWGLLDPAYSVCSVGKKQSPVDLVNAEQRPLPEIEFDYNTSAINIVNTGHSIQINVDPGSSIAVERVRYQLVQFHFHHRSEHTIAGQQQPMELHFVHSNNKDELAVVGVFLIEGQANAALAPVWHNLPEQPTPEKTLPGTVDLDALLPQQRTTWRYSGSLTTPPCSEGVSWFVMTDGVEVSAEQIAKFSAIYPNNFRPVQPLNGRQLVCDSDHS